MNDYLLRHAIENVWCNPTMDRQHVYKLAKLSPGHGVKIRYAVNYESFDLPSSNEYYHVYQIGKVVPIRLGLPTKLGVWMTLSEVVRDNLCLMDLFLENGLQFPRFETYVRIQADRNVVFAVKKNDLIGDIDTLPVFVRFYTNAYFSSDRSSVDGKRFIRTQGVRPKTTTEILQFQNKLNQVIAADGGFPLFWVNGRSVHELSLTTIQVGDVAEYVLDGSITGFKDFKVTDMPTFTSSLDKVRKYIIHYDDANVKSIRFFDDLEVQLFKPLPVAGRWMGVTYHRAKGDWLRMLTHKDYSISIPRLQTFVDSHPTDPRNIIDPVRWNVDKWESLSQLTMRVYFRNSGYDRPLQADANRIQELYKLKSSQIIDAMTGTKASNPLWKAEALEQCPYVKFMNMPAEFVYPISYNLHDQTNTAKEKAIAFAGDVYGYHSAATILAETPSKVYALGNQRVADLKYEHWYDATIFEYDAVGALIGYHYHTAGQRYTPRSPDCAMVEAVTGFGGDRMATSFGLEAMVLPSGYNYRLYVSSVWAGAPQGDWVDITDHPERNRWGYLDDTTDVIRWVWTADAATWYGAIRVDTHFLLETFSFGGSNGVYQLNISSVEKHDTEEVNTLMEIPFGELGVFIQDPTGRYRPLIEGLDFTVKWPRVVLHNLEYRRAGAQSVLLRGYGFCEPDLKRPAPSEIGFIKHDVLSNDNKYHIHSHKVQRIIVDGHLKFPGDVVFEEQLNALKVADERNGAPYIIDTPQVRFKDVYVDDAKARVEDDERDRLVAEYMQMYYPTRRNDGLDTITHRYRVYSTFSNKLVVDLLSGRLNPTGLMGQYSDMKIKEWLASYEWLLDYDLCNTEYNRNHVLVHPHWFDDPQGLQLHHYNFLVRALKLYLRYPPNFSTFIFVKG